MFCFTNTNGVCFQKHEHLWFGLLENCKEFWIKQVENKFFHQEGKLKEGDDVVDQDREQLILPWYYKPINISNTNVNSVVSVFMQF